MKDFIKNFKPRSVKGEKIYKFVYRVEERYGYSNDKSMLLTARDPVSAVKLFNSICGDKLVDVTEFIVITPKEMNEG